MKVIKNDISTTPCQLHVMSSWLNTPCRSDKELSSSMYMIIKLNEKENEMKSKLLKILIKRFNYPKFRGNQLDAIGTTLSGKDLILLMVQPFLIINIILVYWSW